MFAYAGITFFRDPATLWPATLRATRAASSCWRAASNFDSKLITTDSAYISSSYQVSLLVIFCAHLFSYLSVDDR